MLAGLSIYVPPVAEPPKLNSNKKKLKIRISLFFDGTKNNDFNIEEREKSEMGQGSASYSENGSGSDNSYDNGRTNIALMEPEVIERQKDYNHSFTIYIEGQGTNKYQEDDLHGYAMGGGNSGVAGRAKKGVQDLLDGLREYFKINPPIENIIEKIDVDVFGFSRGAATARYFVFLIMDNFWVVPLWRRIRIEGYEEITEKNVEVKFAGLYDTVVSYYGSQLAYFADNELQQRAVALVTKSIHLAAAEEHRLDFPLHTIKSAVTKGKGKEFYLPGVHSDVGGSYNQANKLQAEAVNGKPKSLKILHAVGSYDDVIAKKTQLVRSGTCKENTLVLEVTAYKYVGRTGVKTPSEAKLTEICAIDKNNQYMRTTNELDKVINCGDVIALNADKNRLIEQGWYKPQEITIKSALGLGYLVVNRINIKTAYSNIPLKIMAKFATENGIEFNSKLQERANLVLGKEPDLQKLEKSIESYVARSGNGNSKPDDWLDKAIFDNNNLKVIRHDHLHMSASTTKFSVINVGFTPRFTLTGKRRRYYYEG